MEYRLGVKSRKRLGVTVLAGLLGYVVNGFTIQVWNGVEIVLGSAFSYLTAALFGPWWGAIAASMTGGRTVAEWGHPFAALLHVTEILVVGWLIRVGVPVAPAAVAFWMSLGLPLVVFLYGSHLGLSWPFVSMIGLADFLSGLIGALFTHILLWNQRVSPLFRKLGAGHLATPSLRSEIFTGMILVGTIPLFALLLYGGTALRVREEGSAKLLLARHAGIVAKCIDGAHKQAIELSMALHSNQRRPGDRPVGMEVREIGPGARVFWSPAGRGSLDSLPPLASGEFDVPLAFQEQGFSLNGVTQEPIGVLRVQPALRCEVAVRDPAAIGVSISEVSSKREIVSYGAGGNTGPESGPLTSSELLEAIEGSTTLALTFRRNATDRNPFRKRTYLAGHAVSNSGLRVVFYQPAASATMDAAQFQMWASFWVMVAVFASASFAAWFGRRVVSPVRDLRDYLEGVNVTSERTRPLPQQPEIPFEMLPLWSGVRNLQERTILAVRQAEEAADTALGATRQKSEFLATISHEIRTSLNCILGMLPRVRAESLSKGQSDALSLVDRSGLHLRSILNDVLEFSRIEQGDLQIRSDPLETITIREEAFEMLAPGATQKGLDLTWLLSPDLPAFCKGDALRIKQILLNLVGNAVKFTESGSIEIDVSWEGDTAPEAEGAIVCRVRDTGPGIDQDHIDRLFQPFWQLSQPVGTPPNIGAGLGLSIIKRMLDKMGGEIRIESVVGIGTNVSVSIPVKIVQQKPAPSGKTVVIAGSAGRVRDNLASQLHFVGCAPEVRDDVPMDAAGGRGLLVEEELAHAREQENPGYLRSLINSGWQVVVYQSHSSRILEPAFVPQPLGIRYLPAPSSVRMLRAACYESADASAQTPELPAESESTENSLRILVAEDNAENRLVIELMLHRLGYRPIIVNDGLEAWNAIQSNQFNLAILDLRMPGLDGLSLARKIRENLAAPPKLVALTASAFDSDRKLCLEAGFSEFLSKPIQESSLLSVLSTASSIAGTNGEETNSWCRKNLTSFLEICGARADGMIQTVLDDISTWLCSPIRNTPPEQVAERAHKLAGSALLIGAATLAKSLKAIEAAATAGASPLAEAIESATASYETTCRELAAIRKPSPPGQVVSHPTQ